MKSKKTSGFRITLDKYINGNKKRKVKLDIEGREIFSGENSLTVERYFKCFCNCGNNFITKPFIANKFDHDYDVLSECSKCGNNTFNELYASDGNIVRRSFFTNKEHFNVENGIISFGRKIKEVSIYINEMEQKNIKEFDAQFVIDTVKHETYCMWKNNKVSFGAYIIRYCQIERLFDIKNLIKLIDAYNKLCPLYKIERYNQKLIPGNSYEEQRPTARFNRHDHSDSLIIKSFHEAALVIDKLVRFPNLSTVVNTRLVGDKSYDFFLESRMDKTWMRKIADIHGTSPSQILGLTKGQIALANERAEKYGDGGRDQHWPPWMVQRELSKCVGYDHARTLHMRWSFWNPGEFVSLRFMKEKFPNANLGKWLMLHKDKSGVRESFKQIKDYVRMQEETNAPLVLPAPKQVERAHRDAIQNYKPNKEKMEELIPKFNAVVESSKHLNDSYELYKSKYDFVIAESQEKLDEETKFLKHCVVSYFPLMARGDSIIFFMRENGLPCVTLELVKNSFLSKTTAKPIFRYQLTQMRGKNNSIITAVQGAVIKKWCDNNRISNIINIHSMDNDGVSVRVHMGQVGRGENKY